MIKIVLAIGFLYSVLSEHRHVTYIDRINTLSPVSELTASLGLPSAAQHSHYGYINLGYLMETDHQGAIAIWSNPVAYFGTTS